MKRLFFIILLAGASFADPNLDAAIGWLKSAQDPATGEINHYGVWGTAWGTVAMSLYGEEDALNKSLSYIVASQNPDGGIPYELGSPWGSGVDYSAPAILAYVYSNRTPDSLKNNNRTPVDFIKGTQGAGGGYGEWGEDTVSTSLAVMALSSVCENTTRAAQFILSKQNSTDGGFEWWTKSEATAQALIALNAAGVNNTNTTVALYYLKGLQNSTSGGVVDPYVTTFSAIAFNSYGWATEKEMAIGYLRAVQNESGRIGKANTMQASDALTTALSALAFMDFKFNHVASCSPAGSNQQYSIVSPEQNQTYNLGDNISVMVNNVEGMKVYLDGTQLNGSIENGTYSYGFAANQTGKFTLTFNISGAISERNFTVLDRYSVQITNPGGCAIGSTAQIEFGVLDANGNAVSNSTAFACFNGACAQTDGGSYQYTCAGSNTFYANASKNGNFGEYTLTFTGTNPQPAGGGGGSYVTVEVEFPPNSGRHDISRVFNYGECEYAYDCFTKAVPLECSWWSAIGGLACPGSSVSMNCLATGVDGISAGSGSWWSFYTNGALSMWGISCYKANPGDRIKLKYVGEYRTENTQTPPPAVNGPTALSTAVIVPAKNITNRTALPKESPAPKPSFTEKNGFRIAENMSQKFKEAAKNRVTIVSGANAPCPTCDFTSALLLKANLEGLNVSAGVTTDDRVSSCSEGDTIIFIGGPDANRGVTKSYWNVTGSSEGAIYPITQDCFVLAGNTRELTSKAVSTFTETFK